MFGEFSPKMTGKFNATNFSLSSLTLTGKTPANSNTTDALDVTGVVNIIGATNITGLTNINIHGSSPTNIGTGTDYNAFITIGNSTNGNIIQLLTGPGKQVVTSNNVLDDGTGLAILERLNIPALTASQVVVTDGLQTLASMPYTNLNTASTIVQRDGSGNFSAGTITAATGLTVTGTTSIAGTANINTTGTAVTNIGAGTSGGNINIGTNTSYSGTITIGNNTLTPLVWLRGIVETQHNILDDVTGAATFSTTVTLNGLTASQAVVTDAGKNLSSVAYTSAGTANTLVLRDGGGGFSASSITSSLFVGALTGHASLDLALTGGTLSGGLSGTTGAFSSTLIGSGVFSSAYLVCTATATNGLYFSAGTIGGTNYFNINSTSSGGITFTDTANSSAIPFTISTTINQSKFTSTTTDGAIYALTSYQSGSGGTAVGTDTEALRIATNYKNRHTGYFSIQQQVYWENGAGIDQTLTKFVAADNNGGTTCLQITKQAVNSTIPLFQYFNYVTFSSNGTVTAGQLVSGASLLITGTTNAISTDTASNITATMQGSSTTTTIPSNSGFDWKIVNTSSSSVTFTAGTGVTLLGNHVIASNASAIVRVIVFSPTTVTMLW